MKPRNRYIVIRDSGFTIVDTDTGNKICWIFDITNAIAEPRAQNICNLLNADEEMRERVNAIKPNEKEN